MYESRFAISSKLQISSLFQIWHAFSSREAEAFPVWRVLFFSAKIIGGCEAPGLKLVTANLILDFASKIMKLTMFQNTIQPEQASDWHPSEACNTTSNFNFIIYSMSKSSLLSNYISYRANSRSRRRRKKEIFPRQYSSVGIFVNLILLPSGWH